MARTTPVLRSTQREEQRGSLPTNWRLAKESTQTSTGLCRRILLAVLSLLGLLSTQVGRDGLVNIGKVEARALTVRLRLNLELRADEGVPDNAGPHVVEHGAPDVVLEAHGRAAVGEEADHEQVDRPSHGRNELHLHLDDHEDDPRHEEELANDAVDDGLGHAQGLGIRVHALERGMDGNAGAEEAEEGGPGLASNRDGRSDHGLEALEDVEQLGVEALGYHDVLVAHLLLERTPEREHKVTEEDGEGEPRDDGDGAEGPLDARGDETSGDGALGDAPEDLLGDGRLRQARGRLKVVDVRARVGRGDEVDDGADVERHLEKAGDEPVRLDDAVDLGVLGQAGKHVVALGGQLLGVWSDGDATGVVLGAVDRGVVPVGALLQSQLGDALHLDGEAAEDREPDDGEESGREETTNDELAHGAALGDLGNEEADEWRPRNPPCPIEDCPPVHERFGAVSEVEVRGVTAVRVHVALAPRGDIHQGRLGAVRREAALPVTLAGGGRQHGRIVAARDAKVGGDSAAGDARGGWEELGEGEGGSGLRRAHAVCHQGRGTAGDQAHQDDA
mmetsp:Transcript_27867/g.90082  ORF Transcript_27867/g.90082 Transcript_27867/m.90082 type:complete len:562 (-) Transcript_27867:1435-3120(-)